MDDRESPGIIGIIAASIPAVIHVIEDDAGVTVITQGSPAKIIISPVPAHPGRTPDRGGDPVPPVPKTPVPSAVVIGAPAPRFVRNPCPAAQR